jgi:hypothetical protein
MRPILALTGLAALTGTPAAAAAHCSEPAAEAAGAAVRTARAQLEAIPLGDSDSSIKPAAGAAIERTKDRIRTFVQAKMACAAESPKPAILAGALMAEGDGFVDSAPYDPENAPPDRHGNVLAYQVAPVPAHPEMLAVVATLGIKCGSDSMLMLYGRTGGGWREVMVRRSEPYKEISGGWQDLHFAVSPPDSDGRWFVATVSSTPWCSSAWQGMPYALARPGKAPDRPDVFFRGKGVTYLGNDEDLSVRAEPGAVEIRHDGSSIDPSIVIRRHVLRYAISGDRVRRVQPVAENVRDFADEWIASKWAEAKDWSGGDRALEASHSAVAGAHYKTLDEFASIRDCEDGLTQIEIADRRGAGWFLFARGDSDGPWTMERVERQARTRCTGPDRLSQPD